MSKIFVAETTTDKMGDYTFSVREEISLQELQQLNSAFEVTGILHAITEIKNIVIENGLEFQRWMEPENVTKLYFEKHSIDQLVLTANKLALNYASSIKTFLDIEYRLLEKKKLDKLETFINLTHHFYDTNLEYRFWCNFRNYIVHCSLPYTSFSANIEKGCEIRCSKAHLLEFRNWKQSKADIQNMPDYIDLPGLVFEMSGSIVALYTDFHAYWGSEIIQGIETYGEFCRSHNVKSPIIIKGEILTDGAAQPLAVKELMSAFEVLKSHPRVKINISES